MANNVKALEWAEKLKTDYRLHVKVYTDNRIGGKISIIYGTTRVLFSQLLTAFAIVTDDKISMKLIEAAFNSSIGANVPCIVMRANSYTELTDVLMHFGLLSLTQNKGN